MSVSWNKKYNPVQVITKIESARKTGNDGKKVGFSGWGFREFEALIYSMFDFPNDMPEVDARGLVSKAIFSLAPKGEITVKNLLAEVCKLEQEYQSLPTKKYILATSISIRSSLKLRRIKLGNTLVIFESLLPTRIRQEIDALSKNAEGMLFASLPTNYFSVRVHTSAKSIHHAANQALDSLDVIRGIWNWRLNRRHSSRITLGGIPKPVNNIILGPLHTLHKPNGELAVKGIWWYETSYLGAVTPFSLKENELESLNRSLNYLKKKFKTHKYPQLIQNALIRYTRALDERDWATAFLKLWSILELLTDTGRASYDTTIERIVSLYKEREYHMQVLRHLREYRNSSVHFDKSNSQMEIYLYQIKNYVETLIDFHLNNKYRFESIQDAAGFLSLPHDDETLKSQIDKRNLARKFRGYA